MMGQEVSMVHLYHWHLSANVPRSGLPVSVRVTVVPVPVTQPEARTQ